MITSRIRPVSDPPPLDISILLQRIEWIEVKLQRLMFFAADLNTNLEDVTARVIAMEQAAQRGVVDGT